jgi:phosphoserine phosphatase
VQRFNVIAVGGRASGEDARAVEAAIEADGAVIVGRVEREPAIAIEVEDARDGAPRARAVALRRAIAAAVTGRSIDLAVRAAGHPAPRLVVFDMDSTLLSIEVIDELARMHGVGDEVAAVTERAMRGELDFEASLRARVGKLIGLSSAALDELAARLPLSDGAASLIEALHARGVAVAIASGGFTFAAGALRTRFGLHEAHANQLELADGALTGRVIGDVITAERKAAIIDSLAAAGGIAPDEIVAIGDGANDRLMLARAGFGVAFRAKPALAAVADATIDHGGLDRVLAFLKA